MIRYTCGQCGAKLESPDSLGGELDKCPMCGFACAVPRLKPPKRRPFLILGGAAGLLAGAVLAVVITIALTSGTGPSPSPSKDSTGPKTTAKAVVPPAVARREPTGEAAMIADLKARGLTLEMIAHLKAGGHTLDEIADMKARADRLMPKPPTTAPAWKSKAIPVAGQAPAPLSPEQIFEKASPAVVYITVRDKDFKPIGMGSGFFVDANGLIVTNYHVIKGAEFATARLSTGATLFLDGVVATDPTGDLALLKVSGGGFPWLKRSSGALPKVGAAVYAIGNPRGLENTFSSGMVSGHRETKPGITTIQVTTPISPGSSGGPLLNASGEVVGVTTAYLTTGQNLNFAVPVSAISALIRKQGKVQTLASAGGGRLSSTDTEQLNKAWAAINKKDWDTATRILTALCKTQPDNPFVWYALGELHRRLGNYEIAIEQYKKAVAVDPNFASAYFLMGSTYGKLNRYPEAIEAYKKAIAIDPNDATAYKWIGHCYHELKRYPEAIEAYKKAIAIKPDSAFAYWRMGDAYGKLNRYPEAIEAYKKAIAIKPDSATAYYGLGETYCAMNRYPEAIEAYKKAIAIEPGYAFAYHGLGSTYWELNRYPEAIAALEQFLRLEPTGAMADSVRKDLPRLRRLAGK